MKIFFEVITKFISVVVPVLIAVAFFTVVERKVIGSIQRRLGPNVVGIFGIFQAFADGLKLLVKESIFPSAAANNLFLVAPILTFALSIISWSVLPVIEGVVIADVYPGILVLFAISSLGVYGIIIAGWSSNSKYAFLGALRSTAQIVSYEVSLGFTLVSVILCTGNLNISEIVYFQKNIWLIFPLFPIFIVFFVSALAETNRHPFDLPEAEAELVSGYNVEYSAIGFALFFLGEYANIILISGFTVLMFVGGWLFPFITYFDGSLVFAVKTLFFIIIFVWARAALPRYRYDQLIRLGWKVFLPISIGWVVIVSGVILGFNGLALL